MSSTIDTQFTPFIETFGDTLTQLVEGAAKVGRESTRTYAAGFNAMVEQQRLAYEVSQQWVSDVVRAQSNIRQAVTSATRKQSEAVTRTSRRPTATKSKSASTDVRRSGPAKWTSEAYDALTAAEVVEQLPQLSQRELGEVETYEQAHQSRQTVLQRLTSLRGQQPVPGYDELNVQEIHKQLAEGDAELAARVRDYERPRKNRDGVLTAADAQLSKS